MNAKENGKKAVRIDGVVSGINRFVTIEILEKPVKAIKNVGKSRGVYVSIVILDKSFQDTHCCMQLVCWEM
jgi:hypothetical protein